MAEAMIVWEPRYKLNLVFIFKERSCLQIFFCPRRARLVPKPVYNGLHLAPTVNARATRVHPFPVFTYISNCAALIC